MNHRLARAALAAGTASVMLAGAFAPTLAAAQSSQGYYGAGGGYYDDCRQERNGRAVTGAVIGGILGAVVGSQVSGHGARTEGSVVGGGLGAIGGAAVGSGSADCTTGGQNAYYGNRDGAYDQGAYDGDRYGPQPYRDDAYSAESYRGPYRDAYRDGYDAGRGDVVNDGPDDGEYDYDQDFRAVPVAQAPPSAEDCRLAESAIYMPDGRVQKRFVRVCRDAGGQYHTVE